MSSPAVASGQHRAAYLLHEGRRLSRRRGRRGDGAEDDRFAVLVDLGGRGRHDPGGRGKRVLDLHQPRIGAAVVPARLGQLLRELVLQFERLLLLRGGGVLEGEELGLLGLQVVRLGLERCGLAREGRRLRREGALLGFERRGVAREGGGVRRELLRLPAQRPGGARQAAGLSAQGRSLGQLRPLLGAEVGDHAAQPLRLGLEPGEQRLERGPGVGLGRRDLRLERLDAGEDGRELALCGLALGRVRLRLGRGRLRARQEVACAFGERRDLTLQHGPLGLHLGALALERGRLALEVGLLRLQIGLLLLERRLLGRELRRLGLELGLLLLALGLLLLQLRLQGVQLVLLSSHRRAGLRRAREADRHQQRAVVAHPEPLAHQVVGLALGGVGGRRADVLLAERQRAQRNGQEQEERNRDADRHERPTRHRVPPGGPEAGARLPVAGAHERRDAQRLDPVPDQREQRGQ